MAKEIKYKGKDLEGLINYLHSSESYVDYSKSVQATASSSLTSDYNPSKAIDFKSSAWWHPGVRDKVGEYLQIEIKSGWIDIEGYSFQTSNGGVGYSNPKNWGFSASKDGNKWTPREDYVDISAKMNEACRTIYLPVKHKGIYKYFRFIVTGESHDTSGQIKMDINQVDFFGKYYHSNYPKKCTARCNRHSDTLNIIFVLLMMSK